MSAEKASESPISPDGTFKLLGRLGMDPRADIRCSLGEDAPAVAVFATPAGCAARPNDRLQALCLQHMATDGFVEPPILVADLTEGESWSQESGRDPLLHLGFSADDAIACVAILAAQGVEIK